MSNTQGSSITHSVMVSNAAWNNLSKPEKKKIIRTIRKDSINELTTLQGFASEDVFIRTDLNGPTTLPGYTCIHSERKGQHQLHLLASAMMFGAAKRMGSNYDPNEYFKKLAWYFFMRGFAVSSDDRINHL